MREHSDFVLLSEPKILCLVKASNKVHIKIRFINLVESLDEQLAWENIKIARTNNQLDLVTKCLGYQNLKISCCHKISAF